MRRGTSWLLALLLLAALGAAIAPARAPAAAEERLPDARTGIVEFWRLGLLSERGAAAVAARGRPAQAVAALRSERGDGELFWLLPAPASGRTVLAARVILLERSGSYPGGAALSLEARGLLDGELRRTLTTVPLDLQAAPTGEWIELALPDAAAARELGRGERLAARVLMDAGPAGDLQMAAAFEVIVLKTGDLKVYLPLMLSD